MILTLKDRLTIPNLLPISGGMIEMILVKSISDKIALTPGDIETYGVKQEDDIIKWDSSKDTGVEIGFAASEIELLKKQVQEMDANKNITMQTFDLCMKIKNL